MVSAERPDEGADGTFTNSNMVVEAKVTKGPDLSAAEQSVSKPERSGATFLATNEAEVSAAPSFALRDI